MTSYPNIKPNGTYNQQNIPRNYYSAPSNDNLISRKSSKSNLKQHKKFPTSPSTSIPTVIGSTTTNSTFQPISIDGEVLSPNTSYSAATLGISRPTYGSNPGYQTADLASSHTGGNSSEVVDFSPILQVSKRRPIQPILAAGRGSTNTSSGNNNYYHPAKQSQAPPPPPPLIPASNQYRSSLPQQQMPKMPLISEPKVAAADTHNPYSLVVDDLAYDSDSSSEDETDAKSIGGRSIKSNKSSKSMKSILSIGSKSQQHKKKRPKSPFRNPLSFFGLGGPNSHNNSSSNNNSKQVKQKQLTQKQQSFHQHQQHQQQKQHLLQQQKQQQSTKSFFSTEQESTSTLGFDQSYYNDGSMDLHASIANQVERAMYKQSSTDFVKELTKEEAFDHDRFFVPVQESNSTSTTPTMTANDYYAKPGFFASSSTRNQKKNTSKRRQIFQHHNSSSAFSSSFSAWPEESTEAMQFTSSLPSATRRPQSEPPTLVSASNLKAKKKSLGIAPPPKNTNRIIVPSSHSNDNMNSSNYASPKSKDFTLFVLLIEPKKRIFELIRIHYDPSITTLKQLLHLIPDNCTEVKLATQSYLGFIRPHARSSSNKALANLNLTASVMARDGSCARIASGEVLAAIPKGFTYKETQVLAKHIMKNPKMQKLLSKKKKKTFSRSSKRSTVSSEVDASEEATSSSFPYSESNDDGTGGVSHLGITPRNSNYERETEAVTDSGIYSSSHSVHSAVSLSLTAPGSPAMGKMNKERMKLQEKIRSSVSLSSDSSRNLVNNSDNSNHDKVAVDRDRRDSGDVSCCSSITTTGTPTRLGKKQKEGIDKRTSKLHVVTNLDMKDILRNMNSPDRPSNRKTVENRLASPAAIDRKNVENRLASPETIDRKNVENRLASPTASESRLDKFLESPNMKTESYLVSPGKTSRKPLHHLSYPRTILEGEASTDDVIDTGSVGKLDRFLEESSKKTSNSRLTTRDKKNAVNRLIVDNDDPFQKLASGQIHLDLHQLEKIKREATEAAKAAAKIAAEAAFAKKMHELVHTLDLPEDEKNCLLDDDDASYYSAMSTAMSVALSPLTSDDASCDFPVNISITGQTPSAPSEVRLMGNQGTRACASEIKVISPYAPPSGTVLLSPLMPMSHQKPNASSSSPIPCLTASTPDTVEIVKRDSMYRSNPNSTSTYTQSTSDDEYSELSLIAETMEGFKGLAMDKVSKFIAKNTKSFGQVPSKMLKRKLHLKVMASVCMAFIVSQGLSGVDENDDIGTLSRELLFKDELAVSSTHDVGSDMGEDLRKFSFSDLQCILLCFLVLTKGQKFLSHAKSAKRKRRTWKSRVIPVN